MHVGQTIAIPVLNRHIEHSSGVCAKQASGEETSRVTDCVMADAVRDRFKGATEVNVGGEMTDFILDGQTVQLAHNNDMNRVIGLFDREVDDLIENANQASRRGETFDLKAALKQVYGNVRAKTPRVVHATVNWLDSEF